MIELEQASTRLHSPIAKIKVIGVGGAGGNTVNSIIAAGVDGFECIVVNTDMQALELSKAHHCIQIGVKSAKGLGTGANPEVGARAAEEDIDKVMEAVDDADIVFLTGGMGGGTGSGALPIIAHKLKEQGILSIAIVTKPFLFEGKRRATVAQAAVDKLKKEVDTLIIMPNQKLLDLSDKKVSMIEAFGMINAMLGQSVRSISDIITKPGHINVDFADVRTIMKDRGLAVMGTGRASGSDRAINAAKNAISSPLLENVSIEGAHAVLLNITGGNDLGLHEIGEAASIIYDLAHEDANIIIGSVVDESLEDEIIITAIATGFEPQKEKSCSVNLRPTVLDRSEKKPEPIIAEKQLDEQRKEESKDNLFAKGAHETGNINNYGKEEKRTAISAQESSIKTHALELSNSAHDLDVPTFLRKEATDTPHES